MKIVFLEDATAMRPRISREQPPGAVEGFSVVLTAAQAAKLGEVLQTHGGKETITLDLRELSWSVA